MHTRSFPGPYFPAFGLNTEIYRVNPQIYKVNLHTQSQYVKERPEKLRISTLFTWSLFDCKDFSEKLSVKTQTFIKIKLVPKYLLRNVWTFLVYNHIRKYFWRFADTFVWHSTAQKMRFFYQRFLQQIWPSLQ